MTTKTQFPARLHSDTQFEEVVPPAEEEKPPAEEEKPPEEDEKPPEEEDKPPISANSPVKVSNKFNAKISRAKSFVSKNKVHLHPLSPHYLLLRRFLDDLNFVVFCSVDMNTIMLFVA